MSFQWDVRPTEAWVQMSDSYLASIHRAVYALAQRYAPEIEAWMKQNAPWTDRTGNARQTLETEVEDVALQMVDIYLRHGMSYGEYLEHNYGGRYAIIGPALDVFAVRIWNDIVGLFR